MKIRFWLTAMTALAASVAFAGSAGAGMIAGWDFSQYYGDNTLSIDGANYTDTLNANYSNLDPTSGAGAASAQYGQMFINGQHGSTAVDVAGAAPAIVPLAPSLGSNINAPLASGTPGVVPFDTMSVLLDEGQTFANSQAMIAQAPVSVVFAASLISIPETGSDWGISFGGKTLSGTSVVNVSYSLDGVSYGAGTNVNLTSVDTPFSVAFGPITADVLYVRLNLTAASGNPVIDNVALNASLISVPEPAAAVLLGAGLALVAGLRRRSA